MTVLYYRYKEVTSSEIDKYSPQLTHAIKNWAFVVEFVILAATPLPYFDYIIETTGKGGLAVYYTFDDLILSIMAFRGIFFLRAVFNYSIYTDPYSKKLS